MTGGGRLSACFGATWSEGTPSDQPRARNPRRVRKFPLIERLLRWVGRPYRLSSHFFRVAARGWKLRVEPGPLLKATAALWPSDWRCAVADSLHPEWISSVDQASAVSQADLRSGISSPSAPPKRCRERGSRNLEIDYTAPSFAIPERVRFRYQLEGRDTGWGEPVTRRQAFYNDLGPGRVIAFASSPPMPMASGTRRARRSISR